MNEVTAQHAGLAVRASDAEREQTTALLQRSLADGRLTPDRQGENFGSGWVRP